jgi:hypothetical protein
VLARDALGFVESRVEQLDQDGSQSLHRAAAVADSVLVCFRELGHGLAILPGDQKQRIVAKPATAAWRAGDAALAAALRDVYVGFSPRIDQRQHAAEARGARAVVDLRELAQ